MLFLAEPTHAAAVPTIGEPALWAILLAPLVGWGLIVLSFRKVPAIAGYIAIAAVGIACALLSITLGVLAVIVVLVDSIL